MASSFELLESRIRRLTLPLNGQFPRPWMTDLVNPLDAQVFIVGKNQAKGYSTELLTHERHVNALFNRNGERCRDLYEEMTGGSPSPTRKNLDRLRKLFEAKGVRRVLETNVVCYSTPMSADLHLPHHSGGVIRGTEIFCTVVALIRPKVIVVHGAGTRNLLSRLLGVMLPLPPNSPSPVECTLVQGASVFLVPSLAPPKWNHWSSWADGHLTNVAKAVASAL